MNLPNLCLGYWIKFHDDGILQEKKNIRPTFSAERIYGGTLLAMCSNDFICFYDWAECRLIRRIDVNVKVSSELPIFPSIQMISQVNCHFTSLLFNRFSEPLLG